MSSSLYFLMEELYIYHQQTLDPVINHYGIPWNSKKNMKINLLGSLVMVDSHLIGKMKKLQFYQQSLSNALIKVRRIRIQGFLQKRKKKTKPFHHTVLLWRTLLHK